MLTLDFLMLFLLTCIPYGTGASQAAAMVLCGGTGCPFLSTGVMPYHIPMLPLQSLRV